MSHDVASDVLDHLVAHAGPLAKGEGREVGGSLEDSIPEKPLWAVELRAVPVVWVEVHVVVVDEDDGVGGDAVAGYLCVPVGDVRDDGGASSADCLPEGGLEEHQLGLVSQGEMVGAEGLNLLPQLGLDGGAGGHVYQDSDGEVGDGAVTTQDVLEGEQGGVHSHCVLLVLKEYSVTLRKYHTCLTWLFISDWTFSRRELRRFCLV